MADKKQWTEENENETLAHKYINEAYSSGVVDNFLANYNVFNGEKLPQEEKDTKQE
mgnify:CR=1 FL=1